ncbi:MAG: GNAT family N-acetyltransferase [Phycisphaeraceae bacterium]
MSDSPSAQPIRSAITVRRARRDEVAQIVDFQIALAKESEALELDPATVRHGVQAIFKHPERGEYWMAQVDPDQSDCAADDPAVAGCLLTLNEWSDWRNGTVLWIHSVYVAPGFRRRGVFRTMYRHLEVTVLEDDALHGLRLFVDKGNQAAQRTYEALGMSDDHYRLFEWLKE